MKKKLLTEEIKRMQELSGIQNEVSGNWWDFGNDKKVEEPKKNNGYLADMPRELAWKIHSKNAPDETKRILSDIVKSSDNPLIMQNLLRWIKNSIEGKNTSKLGHSLAPFNLSREQGEYLISKIHELAKKNSEIKQEFNGMLTDFLDNYPMNNGENLNEYVFDAESLGGLNKDDKPEENPSMKNVNFKIYELKQLIDEIRNKKSTLNDEQLNNLSSELGVHIGDMFDIVKVIDKH